MSSSDDLECQWDRMLCRTISQRPLVKESGARVHFIDDRFETVRAVRDAPDLGNVVVYLADW